MVGCNVPANAIGAPANAQSGIVALPAHGARAVRTDLLARSRCSPTQRASARAFLGDRQGASPAPVRSASEVYSSRWYSTAQRLASGGATGDEHVLCSAR